MQPAWLGGTETDKRRKIFDKILQFSDFSILYACFGAVPCAYLPQGLITELDNGFQQNTRHTGRPSRHSRSIPMRRMFPNWAHRHRPPASHALTGGAPVADVLPEGKITTRRHLRSPHPVCRASWKVFCRKGKVPRRRVSGEETPRQGLRFRFGKCHEEALPLTAHSLPCLVENVLPEGKSAPQKSLRQSDISTGASVQVWEVPRGKHFRPPCHAADVLSESNRRKRDTRRPHSPPHHQTPAADKTKT